MLASTNCDCNFGPIKDGLKRGICAARTVSGIGVVQVNATDEDVEWNQLEHIDEDV